MPCGCKKNLNSANVPPKEKQIQHTEEIPVKAPLPVPSQVNEITHNKKEQQINDNNELFIPLKTNVSVKFLHETGHSSSATACIRCDPLINGGEVQEKDIIQLVKNLGENLIKTNPLLGEVSSYEIDKNIVIA